MVYNIFMIKKSFYLRIVYFLSLVAFLLMVVSVFLVAVGKIHIRSMTSLQTYVDNVSTNYEKIYGERGFIFDSNGQIIAQNEKTYDIICYLDKDRIGINNTPAYVDDPLYTSQVLADILQGDQKEIYQFLTPEKPLYQTEIGSIGRNLSADIKQRIEAEENLHGIAFEESSKRIYPLGVISSPYFVGFAQSDDTGKLVGKMGIESYLDAQLSGEDGLHVYQSDKEGYVLPGMYDYIQEAKDGSQVHLTFDASMQEALNNAFEQVKEINGAKLSFGAVMEVKTGRLLAAGQYPSFDPNTLVIEDYQNYLTQYTYEPGSVMKSFIYATAMDIGKYNGTTGFDSSPFCYYANGNDPYRSYTDINYGCIYNAGRKTWGTIDLDTGLIYSSNVATSTLLTDYVGPRTYEEYLQRFGFFQEVNSDGLSEVTGYKNYYYPSEKLALSYGQGSSVTAIQVLQAYSAIFGNGEMIKPYFIESIYDEHGNKTYQAERTVVSTPIKESTAKQMQALLARVVSDPAGTAKFYGINEINIAAKTGTSEIAVNGSYASNDAITSVVMGLPAENPELLIYFAYIAPYDYYMHTRSEAINNFTRRVVLLTGINLKNEFKESVTTITRYSMDDFTGKNFQNAENVLSEKGIEVIGIGNGNSVRAQNPVKGSSIYTGQKVFLVTDGGEITIPDMKGWTRKDVLSYWQVSDLPMILDGYGVVVSQSLPAGTVFNGEQLLIKFQDIHTEFVETPLSNQSEIENSIIEGENE